jgi:tricarballylate dehydrogenase
MVLEAAPKFYRGGNTRHTCNMRCAHDTATETVSGPHMEEEHLEYLMRGTGRQTDEALAQLMISESKDALPWIQQQGVRFQQSLAGTFRTNPHVRYGGRNQLACRRHESAA